MGNDKREDPKVLSLTSLEMLAYAGLLVAEGARQLVMLPKTLRDNYLFDKHVRESQTRYFGSYQRYSNKDF